MYYLLTEEFKGQQDQMVKMILEAVLVDSIYLLGSTLMTRRTESIFMTDAPSCRYVGHYYLLILIDGNKSVIQIQDKIENTCRNFIPVTALVIHTGQFKDWLTNGHYFASNVYHKAVLLYGEIMEASTFSIDEVNIKFEKERDTVQHKGLNMVNEFIAGAELYQLRKENELATFMLHQATEHSLQTLLKTVAGLHISTHNLDKLIRYCSMISYKILELFPRNNERHERLFKLFQKAYTGTRYNGSYSISNSDFLVIFELVIRLKNELIKINSLPPSKVNN